LSYRTWSESTLYLLEELILDRRDGHCGEDAALNCLLAEIVPYGGTEAGYVTVCLRCYERMDNDDVLAIERLKYS
jgi:hypothetical protein